MKLSLWLVPKRQSPEDRLLRKTIARIAEDYQRPVFAPHITLIGQIEGEPKIIGEKTEGLAKLIAPHEIRFSGIGSVEGNYWRILFLRALKSARIEGVHALAEKIFGMDEGEYMPHCSLAYGDLVPSEVNALHDTLTSDGIAKTVFNATHLQLWKTEGKVTEWRPLKLFPLTGA